MLRVALISRWHVHSHKPDERYAKELIGIEGCRITCVYDKDEKTAREWADEWGVDAETDLDTLLSRDDVDAVLVTSSPDDHREILIKAAEKGKHIFTEKVLSYTMEDAYAIRDAVKKSGVHFAISYNRLGIPHLAYAKEILDSGIIGEPVSFRCLCGHDQGLTGTLPSYWFDPDIMGGGAQIDLGFNSAYLARYIMGEIKSVSSTFSSERLKERSEDTALTAVRFKSGAIGSIEATFVSPLMSVFELSLYGTKGAYYARFGGCDTAELRLKEGGYKTLCLSDMEKKILPPVSAWVKAITNGTNEDAVYGIDSAVDMVRFMIAAYRSAAMDGKSVNI